MGSRSSSSGTIRITAIVNPATRRSSAPIEKLLRERLASHFEVKIIHTTAPNTATQLTTEVLSETDVVVAVGGDGTVGEVAAALVGTDIPLAIIPAGSTNIIARELRIPKNVPKAVALLAGAYDYRLLDIGKCNDRYFVHMAGAGLDSWMFAGTNPRLKRKVGWPAYAMPAFRGLFRPLGRYTILADETRLEVESPLVLVANGQSIISASFPVYPNIKSNDGWLDLIVFTPKGPGAIAGTIGRLATRGLERSPHVFHTRAREIEILSKSPIPVETDGDVVTTTPAKFSIVPNGIKVVVPAL